MCCVMCESHCDRNLEPFNVHTEEQHHQDKLIINTTRKKKLTPGAQRVGRQV